MKTKNCLTVLFTMKEGTSWELVIAERDNGKLYWCRLPERMNQPGDSILMEDTYPLSTLPPERQAAVYEQLKAMPPEVLESLRTGWESEA